MAEILPGVHQVEGVDPSPDFSTHVFLVKDAGPTWTLIDTGLPGSDAPIQAYLKARQIPLGAIRKILLTHLHLDHVGSLRRMAELTKARTYAHWVEAGFIAKKPPYDGPGAPPKEPFQVDEELKDGDRIDAGGGLVAYHTPGHTPGHTAYHDPARSVLFCGDLFMGDGNKLLLTVPEYTHHKGTAQISARRVSKLGADSMMTYHGGPFLSTGGDAVRKLVETF